jgi:hypothetical protein
MIASATITPVRAEFAIATCQEFPRAESVLAKSAIPNRTQVDHQLFSNLGHLRLGNIRQQMLNQFCLARLAKCQSV